MALSTRARVMNALNDLRYTNVKFTRQVVGDELYDDEQVAILAGAEAFVFSTNWSFCGKHTVNISSSIHLIQLQLTDEEVLDPPFHKVTAFTMIRDGIIDRITAARKMHQQYLLCANSPYNFKRG